MPASQQFTILYQLTGNPTDGLSIDIFSLFNSRLVDTADGSDDGMTAVEDDVFWFGPDTTIQLVGFASDGEPVVFNGGIYYLLSTTVGKTGDIGFTTTTGPYTYCFAEGTGIATPEGEVAVEALGIGDIVLTEDGRPVPVKWVGRQTVAARFASVRMVRVAADAFAPGLPRRDLVVTADHALALDGFLVNAGALVNGTTITEVPVNQLADRFTVYHVETEEHDIILAEGTPAETFIDYAGRQAFDNHAEYVALYGEERSIAEMPYPRISTARLVPPALKARLGIRRAA